MLYNNSFAENQRLSEEEIQGIHAEESAESVEMEEVYQTILDMHNVSKNLVSYESISWTLLPRFCAINYRI